ncbi:MAG: IS110 family transposase [Bacteroidetes bacterium]|nr:IS110 family transposase [Bacteroidota bacterium]
MKTYEWFMGIDVSKGKLDIALLKGNEKQYQGIIENRVPAIKSLIKDLQKKYPDFDLKVCLIGVEHTGIYNNHLLVVAQEQQWNLCLESAIHIKQSGGLQRGKNDQVDALRIAQYVYKNRAEIKLWQSPRAVITQLKQLTGMRDRLIAAKKQLEVVLKENESFQAKQVTKYMAACCKKSIHALATDIAATEKKIKEVIENDSELKRLFTIVTSVPGVGVVTATSIVISTNEFKRIKEPRKYACYAGVAPFEHSSGSSVRGKTRVSRKANLHAKSLLHMVAMTAILHNPEMKLYYTRKVAEGKSKMNVINAVRNKIVHQIFACVRDNRVYEKIYYPLLA